MLKTHLQAEILCKTIIRYSKAKGDTTNNEEGD